MAPKIPAKIREEVRQRAKNICEYCLLPDIGALFEHQIDHILPRKHGGETILQNLAFACWRCNLYKGTDVGTFDLETGKLTPLYNPRTQCWTDHFRIETNGIIIPQTPEARITIRLLRINDTGRIEERFDLIEAELY